MAKNPAHLDNFHTTAKNFFRIVSPYVKPNGETSLITYASGRTEEETRTKFYSRFMLRTGDQEMMLGDQKRGGFVMQYVKDNHVTLVEADLLLLAQV